MATIQSQKRTSTMPTPPSPKKGNFFSRHLLHGKARRRSSVSFPNGHPILPEAQAPPQRNGTRKASVGSQTGNGQTVAPSSQQTTQENGAQGTIHTAQDDAHVAMPNGTQNGVEVPTKPTPTIITPDDEPAQPRPEDLEPAEEDLTQVGSTSGVRWVDGLSEGQESSQKRQDSVPRRSSIFTKNLDGYHAEGVDAGAGSKARRLSVHVPDVLEVDECPLTEHFNLLSRMNKKQIGEGGAATVQIMQSKTVGTGEAKQKVFAVKEFREWDEREEDETEYQRKIKSEYAIAKSCVHPNIVETYRLCYSEKMTKWHHVMEFCDQGDLVDIIKTRNFSREDRDCMFKQLLRGVDYLHSRGVAHRDLKAENLLLTKEGCLKIADFGTSDVFSGKHPGLQHCRRPSIIKPGAEIRYCKPGLVGSRPYMAPELLAHAQDYDPRCIDVWSCAIVYVTLILEGNIWDAAVPESKNYQAYADSWARWLAKYPDGQMPEGRQLPDFVYKAPNFAKKVGDLGSMTLLVSMMNPDPAKRITAHEALECKTVVEFACCQQDGYSDDIKTRQRKANHKNHGPPKKGKGLAVKPS
ncbi:hypothetical protein LTR36_004021 [Oleoguttula mirabilis]|uniref:non-specific serine/threonine protein kinase n=1 Tax=Oleoguttula mirabilis TaxID=1507867 RepID=A0AAV9JHA1_9PEZI|nr:hypothetical protein LTR36_004021 [Oleoguttula mirabilis]